MTLAQQTLSTFVNGDKQAAYELFLSDEWAIADTSFEDFCRGMEQVARTAAENRRSEAAHAEAWARAG
jgi:hypothetical protein